MHAQQAARVRQAALRRLRVIQAATLSLRQELFPLQAVPLDWFQLDDKHTLSLQEVQGQHELTR